MRLLSSKKIVVATHNEGKVHEINELIEPYGLIARSAKQHNLAEPVEDGNTFEANAYIKAFAAANVTGLPALSDDSGLCVDALEGAPGIYTADWAEKEDGSGRDFNLAMQKVEDQLQKQGAVNEVERSAYFVAVLCLCWPDGHAEYFRGEVNGNLIWPPRGTKGFGYDPVFKPKGYNVTFGEMASEEKHGLNKNAQFDAGRGDLGLSHRSKAFAKFSIDCLEPSFNSSAQTPEA